MLIFVCTCFFTLFDCRIDGARQLPLYIYESERRRERTERGEQAAKKADKEQKDKKSKGKQQKKEETVENGTDKAGQGHSGFVQSYATPKRQLVLL